MARNQQPKTLRQQVERLVTEGETEKAYKLLKKGGWVPGGSGHQEFYPNGLVLFAKVDWDKQILVSQGGRYWAWEVTLLNPNQYTFLYPISKQFPFDEVCSEIIHELEKRNWEVEGIQVEFDTYGTGAQKYRLVRNLKGKDFDLHFCRIQRPLPDGKWNDTAAVGHINIPKMELSVYNDESSPTLYVYVGKNWEKDKEQFTNGIKTNSKLRKEPRTYLKYTGGWQKPEEPSPHYLYRGKCAPYLVHDNDLGREYDPKLGDPSYYLTTEVMETFKKYLYSSILNIIKATPIPGPSLKGELISQPSMPETIGPIFCFAEWRDADRIQTGRANPAKLQPFERYGLIGSPRFVSLSVKNDGTVPEVAYDGFIWCGLGEITPETSIKELEIPGNDWSYRERFLIRVTPKSANGVYIADMSGQNRYRENIFNINPTQDSLTDSEYEEYLRIPGRTIIPITDYKGGFEKPVILINRELGLDEVEIVNIFALN